VRPASVVTAPAAAVASAATAAAASAAPVRVPAKPPLGLEASVPVAPIAVVPASAASRFSTAEASSGAPALPRFVHADGAAVQGLAVHALLRVFGVLDVLELHEAEAARVTGLSVADHIDFLDGAVLAERLGESVLVGVEAQAPDEQLPLIRHGDALFQRAGI